MSPWLSFSIAMNFLLSVRTPPSPIVFDFAQFLINSSKVDESTAFGPIISRLGFDEDTFLNEMKSFGNGTFSSKKPFVMDKVLNFLINLSL